jgi:hypothetical protein
MSRRDAILAFFRLFPELGLSVPTFDSLKDAVAIQAVYLHLSGDPAPPESPQSGPTTWIQVLKRVRFIVDKLAEAHKGTPFAFHCDPTMLARRGADPDWENLSVMLIAYALKSPRRAEIEARMGGADGDAIRVCLGEAERESPPASPARPQLLPLKAENAQLAKAVEQLRAEVQALKQTPAVTDVELEKAKAELFAEEIRVSAKQQRLDSLLAVESHLISLQQQIEELRLREREAARADGQADYSVLTDRLQELHLDPALQTVEKLEEQTRKLKRAAKAAKARLDGLLARRDGQQDFAVLHERLAFLRKLEEANVTRQQRATLNATILQKKMRQETFQAEMRTFL